MAKVYVLMFRNALSVPSIYNKLIPPLIMRESGLVVKDRAKIYSMNPFVEDHIIYFPNFDIHIMLFLHVVLSYFLTSKP